MKKITLLITGGMGLLGYSMVKYFEKKNKAKLSLTINIMQIELETDVIYDIYHAN